MISRMFSASCDNCTDSYDCGYWYRTELVKALKEDGWKVTQNITLCPNCIEDFDQAN